MEFHHTIIATTEGTDIEFSGQCLAHVSSHRPGRRAWTELSLYVTETGRYVAHEHGLNLDETRNHISVAHVCDTLDDVYRAFGFGRYSKELYRQAGISPRQAV